MENNWGYTALIKASWQGHIEIVQLLLEKEDIDVNIQDNYGMTALMYASKNGHIEVVKLLEDYQKIDL